MEFPVWLVWVALGLVGSAGRLALQIYRDDKWPAALPRPVSLLFLGGLGGGVSYLLGEGHVSAVALGFMASDVIENLLAAMAPKPPGG
jgi:hypothetical protein